MLADDTKIKKSIQNVDSCNELQCDLNVLHNWSQTWKMGFNALKCHVLEMGNVEKNPDGNINWNVKR